MASLLATFGHHQVISFDAIAVADGRSPLVASGLARHDDRWELVVVWSFADVEEAEAAEARVTEVLAGDDSGIIPILVDGDPVEALERDGNVIGLRAPLTDQSQPWSWNQPILIFDRALMAAAG